MKTPSDIVGNTYRLKIKGGKITEWELKQEILPPIPVLQPTKSPAVYMQQMGRANRVITGSEPLEISGAWVEEATQVDPIVLDGVMRALKQHKGE